MIVRHIRYLGSSAYGSGADADGCLLSFVLDRAMADELAARLEGGEPVETAIPTWAVFDGGAVTASR